MPWYDATTSAAGNANLGGQIAAIRRQAVTVGGAGSATKLRAFIRTSGYFGGSEVLKMALYNSTTLLSSGTVTANAGNQYFEITLAAPQSVVAQVYQMGFAYVGSSCEFALDNTTGTYGLNNSGTYTYLGFPYSPYPGDTSTPTGTMCMGVFVDPAAGAGVILSEAGILGSGILTGGALIGGSGRTLYFPSLAKRWRRRRLATA